MRKRHGLFEEDARILEEIATKYGEESREHRAVKHAAIALYYVMFQDYEGFQDYVKKFEGDITPDQRARLIEMGIDPDRVPDK